MAVFGGWRPKGGTIVCNGYKTASSFNLGADWPESFGHKRIYRYRKKESEVAPGDRGSGEMGLTPQVGLRVRLVSLAPANGGYRRLRNPNLLSLRSLLPVVEQCPPMLTAGWCFAPAALSIMGSQIAKSGGLSATVSARPFATLRVAARWACRWITSTWAAPGVGFTTATHSR